MPSTRESQAFMKASSPILEHEHEGYDVEFYSDEVSPSGCTCFCFKFPWGGNRDGTYSQYQSGENKETWWMAKLKELRGHSEVLAGPKWKNMIRKIGGFFKGNKHKNGYQYDSESYALNFDSGMDWEDEDDDGLIRSYSSRFVAPLSSEHHHQIRQQHQPIS